MPNFKSALWDTEKHGMFVSIPPNLRESGCKTLE
jgi:hypothetical protein